MERLAVCFRGCGYIGHAKPNGMAGSTLMEFRKRELEITIPPLKPGWLSQCRASSTEPTCRHLDQLVFGDFWRPQQLRASRCIAEEGALRFRSHELRCLTEAIPEFLRDIANGKLLQTRHIQDLGG